MAGPSEGGGPEGRFDSEVTPPHLKMEQIEGHFSALKGRDNRPPYPPPRGDYQTRISLVLTLEALTKPLKEIMATKTRLQLAPPRPMANPQQGRNMDRFLKENKRKTRDVMEECINTPITFLPVSTDDVLSEPLIVEAGVEGYLVRRVYVDEGALVEVMFEHCFKNLSLKIKSRRKETQTDLVGFAGEATKLLGKIELEVYFENEGSCRRTTMKFTVIRAPSHYNIILGRTGLRTLWIMPSTIHSMMKFPTPRGILTLVSQSVVISKCRESEKRYGYNITFEPRNTMKGQVLADFVTKTPEGELPEWYFRTPEATPERDDTEEWELFTDGASSPKRSGAGLVLIGPSGVTIAKRMNIQKLEANFDSKLVVSQINGSYIAGSDSKIKYLAKVFKNEVENQLGKTIKALRSDRGGYPKETMGYYFYFPPENKIVVASYAELLEKNLISQEANGRAVELEEIQDEYTSPFENTSKNLVEAESFEPPQEDVALVRRPIKTHRAPERLCLNVKV
nr:reverse transcriptase domain-containing protein [Tanacetum cinerariifolium]